MRFRRQCKVCGVWSHTFQKRLTALTAECLGLISKDNWRYDLINKPAGAFLWSGVPILRTDTDVTIPLSLWDICSCCRTDLIWWHRKDLGYEKKQWPGMHNQAVPPITDEKVNYFLTYTLVKLAKRQARGYPAVRCMASDSNYPCYHWASRKASDGTWVCYWHDDTAQNLRELREQRKLEDQS